MFFLILQVIFQSFKNVFKILSKTLLRVKVFFKNTIEQYDSMAWWEEFIECRIRFLLVSII